MKLQGYPLLSRAIEGGVNAATIAPLLQWSPADLAGLIAECEAYCAEAHAAITEAHRKASFDVAIFFSSTRSKELDKMAEQGKMDVLGMCSELCAAALYVLELSGERRFGAAIAERERREQGK